MATGPYRLTITLPTNAIEAVSDAIRPHCGGVVQIQDAETVAAALPSSTASAPLADGRVRLVSYPEGDAVQPLVFELQRLLGQLRDIGLLTGETTIELEEDIRGWAQPGRVVRVAGRFAIAQPWVAYQPNDGEIFLPLDLYKRIGDGSHPATALALLELDRCHTQRRRVTRALDIGCGNGVLSCAAAHLWPDAHIDALDTDARAREVCRANTARLGLDEVVWVCDGPVDATVGFYDLIVAQQSSGELQALAPILKRRLAADGRLVVTGFPEGARDAVDRVFAAEGLFAVEHDTLESWSMTVFVH